MFLSAAVTNKQLEYVPRASMSTSAAPNSEPQNGLTCAAGTDHKAIIVNYEECTQCYIAPAYPEKGMTQCTSHLTPNMHLRILNTFK
jgi:hypothetical protein